MENVENVILLKYRNLFLIITLSFFSVFFLLFIISVIKLFLITGFDKVDEKTHFCVLGQIWFCLDCHHEIKEKLPRPNKHWCHSEYLSGLISADSIIDVCRNV